MTKDWMNDPALSDIDQRKLEFLHTLVIESATLSQKDLLPFFLSLAKRGKDEKINFSKEEMNLITGVIKKNCSDSERSKIDKILKSRPV